MNGLALGAFGLVPLFVRRGKHGFLPFAMLLAVMALTIAGAAWMASGRQWPGRWIPRLAAAVPVIFALEFLPSGLRLVRLQPEAYLVWLSCFFAFSAICMFALGTRLYGMRAVHGRPGGAVPA